MRSKNKGKETASNELWGKRSDGGAGFKGSYF
jgi:hypothetical protein